jgi:hypothetical protein
LRSSIGKRQGSQQNFGRRSQDKGVSVRIGILKEYSGITEALAEFEQILLSGVV